MEKLSHDKRIWPSDLRSADADDRYPAEEWATKEIECRSPSGNGMWGWFDKEGSSGALSKGGLEFDRVGDTECRPGVHVRRRHTYCDREADPLSTLCSGGRFNETAVTSGGQPTQDCRTWDAIVRYTMSGKSKEALEDIATWCDVERKLAGG